MVEEYCAFYAREEYIIKFDCNILKTDLIIDVSKFYVCVEIGHEKWEILIVVIRSGSFLRKMI